MLSVRLPYRVLKAYLRDLLKNYSMYQIRSVGNGFKYNVVANEWLGHLNDHSQVLQEKILLKI